MDNDIKIFDNQLKMGFDGEKIQNKYYKMELE